MWGRKSFDEWVAIARKRGYKVGWARFRYEAQEARYGRVTRGEIVDAGAVGDGTYWVAYSGEVDADTLVKCAQALGAKGVIYSRADNMVMVR